MKYWGPGSENLFSEYTEAHKFCDTVIRVKPAPEPSNIIWENRHITPNVQLRNKIIVAFGILCLLSLAFALFTFAKIQVADIQERYPPTFDCSDIQSQFEDDPVQYENYAKIDKEYTLQK